MLDRTLCLAAVVVAGSVRRRRRRPAEIRRIGVMKSTGMGDMVLATAVVRDIAQAFSEAQIVLIAGAGNAGVARLLDDVEVVVLPMTKPWAAVRRLRQERLDVLIDLGQWTRLEALCSFLSGARYTLGFATPGQHRHFCYDEAVTYSGDVHELENFRRVAARFGVESRSLPEISIPDADAEVPVPGRYVVFHLWPGGFRSNLREWPAECWRGLARRLVGEGFAVVLTGSAADADRADAFVRSCDGLGARLVNVAGRYGLSELAGVLRGASCVVSVNTGVMHLAAATGAPTVALNGPTNEARWGPIGRRAISVNSTLPGCAYLNLGFEYDGRRTDCMEGISLDSVAEPVLRLASDG